MIFEKFICVNEGTILDKNCLSCRYYKNHCCVNDDNFENSNEIKGMTETQSLIEDGWFDECMNEVNFGKLYEFEEALDKTKISLKQKKELMQILNDNIESNLQDYNSDVQNKIYKMCHNKKVKSNKNVSVRIKTPDEFCCPNHW